MLIFVNHDDLRSLEFMEVMIERGYYVSDQFEDMKYADVIYLGVKGIDRKNRLIVNQETYVLDKEKLMSLKESARIFTLIPNAYLKELSLQYHFQYYALLEDEVFLEENSILTAEGLISYLIKHRRFPLYHAKVTVLGFGHCAKPLINYLKAFQSHVTVAIRNEKYQKEIEDMNCVYQNIKNLDLSATDILINTIPSVIVSDQTLKHAYKRIMIVDIASYPYGLSHHYALSLGFNCQILSSIPCKYAYGYAGKMVADYIERVMNYA